VLCRSAHKQDKGLKNKPVLFKINSVYFQKHAVSPASFLSRRRKKKREKRGKKKKRKRKINLK